MSQYVDNALYCLLFPKLLLPVSQGSNTTSKTFGFPDYSKMQSISNGYRANENGYIMGICELQSNIAGSVLINGIIVSGTVCNDSLDFGHYYNYILVPVCKNDVISTRGAVYHLYFIPIRMM